MGTINWFVNKFLIFCFTASAFASLPQRAPITYKDQQQQDVQSIELNLKAK